VIRSRSPLFLGVVLLVLSGVVAGVAGIAYLFLRPAAPPPVGAASQSPAASTPAGATATTPAGESPGPVGDPAGTWTIDPSVGSFSDFSSSFVGYRVVETLANLGANTAVGRTPDITGSLTMDGTTIAGVEVTADLTTLQSDDNRRDGQLERQGIQTGTFPTATFTLSSPIELGSSPVDGQAVSVTATGELTLHGVTKTIQVPVVATRSGDVVTVTGSIDIAFADYNIERPSSFAVLSIEDHGLMEFQLHFRHG
jgi:polyisoprenoid-binding protein YceI